MEIATNGEQALSLVQMSNINYDAILIATSLPVMNGIKAAKEIRKYQTKHKVQETPILMLIGSYNTFEKLPTTKLD